MLDDEDEEETKEEESDIFSLGKGNNSSIVADAMVSRGYKQAGPIQDSFRLKWVQTLDEVNFLKIKEGQHLVNHIPNIQTFTNKVSILETLEAITDSQKFYPETYKLDSVPDLAKFINQSSDEGKWIFKSAYSNCGRGIELISDIKAFKEKILRHSPEQTDELDSNELFLKKMKDQGIESTPHESS